MHRPLRTSTAVVLLLACVLCFSSPGRAWAEIDEITPDLAQSWQVKSYAREAGLAPQRIFDIAFTPSNTAWLATDLGLCRFDGFTWDRFGTNDGLPSAFVRSVCLDQGGRLWVGSDAGAGDWDPRLRKYNSHGSDRHLPNRNVREIDEDPDGTLWFSCDQWPETTGEPGGLTGFHVRTGAWETFHKTNGLPMDYVIGYFRDSIGRQFVMAPHAWVQKQGSEWVPPVNPGYDAEDWVLQMAESKDGTLFAQGEHVLLALINGRWEKVPGRTKLLCATREGDMVAVEADPERGRLWFSRWNGHEFVRASAAVSYPLGGRLYHLRQAPDGALWCVGPGTLIRWAYHSGKWTLFPELPPPVGADALGRTWFAGDSNIIVHAAGRFQTLAPGRLLGWNNLGVALVWDQRQNELMATDSQDFNRRAAVITACATVNSVLAERDGSFWILGRDKQNNGIVARYEHGQIVAIPSDEFRGQEMIGGVVEAPGTLLAMVRPNNKIGYGVARVTAKGVAWLRFSPAPPPLTYPGLVVGAGRNWLIGYSSLYQQSLGSPDIWDSINAFPHGGFQYSVTSAKEFFVTYASSGTAKAGCALYCSNRWIWAAGEFAKPSASLDETTFYLPTQGGVFLRPEPGTLDFDYLQIPDDILVNSAAADSAGSLWLGTQEGTFEYRRGNDPPATTVSLTVSDLRQGAPLPVKIRGQTRFESPADPAGFRYSWRVDSAPWSPFGLWPGESLQLPPLAAGPHWLFVRARDVDGNIDPRPAMQLFNILPEPWQDQPWFLPAATLVGLLLAWLVWLSWVHVRQIAHTNSVLNQEVAVRRQTEAALERARGELEHRVADRTAQLTRSNQQLRRQVAERKLAEAHTRKLEEQLHQSQKMEAIGTLAGGIAHDFNNILAIIIPYCDLAIGELSDRPELQENLREALKAANRAKKLVQQILTFSHRGPQQQRQIVQLQPIVKEAMILLRFVLPSTIQMNQNIQATRPVLADPTQIHQVLMNLCVNAQQALEGRQGEMNISVDEIVANEALCERNPDLHPGPYVRIGVRDNGCGIPPENLDRIFDPFFTTKGVGKGTGLGLAVVQGIVRSHGGAILVESKVGQGSEFQILLPAQAQPVTENLAPAAPAPVSQGEHILIIDDEPGIVSVLKRVLTRAGYRVSAHADPGTAMADLAARPREIDLVITDLTMPGMNGLDVASRVAEIRPELPVILATGFGGSLIEPEKLAAHPNIRHTVEKPFSAEDIVRLIADLLKPKAPV